MTHDLSSNALAAISADVVAPVLMVKLEFDDLPLCIHTGLGEIAWAGDTYVGGGSLASVSGLEESSESARQTITLGLRGLPPDILSLSLSEHYQGRPATILMASMDPQTGQRIGDPWVIRRGMMDTLNSRIGETLALTLTIESEQSLWDKAVTRRYTDADQQSRFPGDRFFEFVDKAQGQSLYWGGKAPA